MERKEILPMKILVTGGAGFIASHVTDAFVEAGHEVVIIDNMSTGRTENVNPKARFVEMDIRSKELEAFMSNEQFEVIDHHAAHIHVGKSVIDPLHDADINVMGTLNLMEAARKSGSVKHVIFAATGGAMYGDKQTPFDESMAPQPLSPYGISKRAVELYLYFYQVQYGITFTSLRYSNVYGPRQNPAGEAGVISIFLDTMKAGKQCTINGDGKQTRDYVNVRDVARANLAALTKRVSGEFNIGTQTEVDVNEIYALVAESAGFHQEALHTSPRPGEQQTSSLSYQKAKTVLGWEPSILLLDGIKQTTEYFLK
jgi:UDP-glucose 4-epimerase